MKAAGLPGQLIAYRWCHGRICRHGLPISNTLQGKECHSGNSGKSDASEEVLMLAGGGAVRPRTALDVGYGHHKKLPAYKPEGFSEETGEGRTRSSEDAHPAIWRFQAVGCAT